MSKLSLWVAASFVGSASTVAYAFHVKKQFFPAMVFLTNSSVCMMFLYMQGFTLGLLLCKLFQWLFFGRLRANEVEHLYDRSWFAITETCLAMALFRDEGLTAVFMLSFGLLLAMKVFHWLAQDRIDFMQQTPNLGGVFHARMLSVFTVLAATDLLLISQAVSALTANGPSMQLVFGFEYTILAMICTMTFCKYVLHAIDLAREATWERKTLYLFYIELVTDLLKLLIYIAFFVILFNYYTLPLYILRDLFSTARAFLKRLHDLVQSRRATRHLENAPDATPEELATVDATCIICRDPMTSGKKLPCGHIFHLNCLRSWLQQHQTCPTCRANVLELEQANRRRQAARDRQAAAAHQPPPAAAGAPVPPWLQGRPQVWQPPPNPFQPPGGLGAPPAAAPPPPAAHQPPAGAAEQPAFPWVQQQQPAAPGTIPRVPPDTPNIAAPGGPAGPGQPPPLLLPFPPLPPPFMMPPHYFAVPPHNGPVDMPYGPPENFVPFNFSPPEAPGEQHLELLSDEEMAQLEGEERAKVAARVKFLRAFRGELDGMLQRYGQYQTLSSAAPPAPPGAAAGPPPESGPAPQPYVGKGKGKAAHQPHHATAGTESSGAASAGAPPASTGPQDAPGLAGAAGTDANADGVEASPSAIASIREQRVRKFSQRESASSSPEKATTAGAAAAAPAEEGEASTSGTPATDVASQLADASQTDQAPATPSQTSASL